MPTAVEIDMLRQTLGLWTVELIVYVQELHTELVKGFCQIELVTQIAIATLLDPRFKNLHFKDPNTCAKGMAALRNLIRTNMSSSDSGSDEISSPPHQHDFWAPHKLLAQNQVHKKRKNQHLESTNDELSLYLVNGVSSLNSNPLEEWEKKETFPALYKQARIHFVIAATSVPCKRLFSKAGATKTQVRNILSSSRLGKLLFLGDLPDECWFDD